LGDEQPDVVLLRVMICGSIGSERKTITYEMALSAAPDDILGAVRTATSVPTAIVAETLASGEVPGGGAAVPEVVLDKPLFLERLGGRGMPVAARWHDGWLEISDPNYSRTET
jgi:saccharopine dehydrogenase-like NADP-dependent oxidoreductase